MEEESVEFNTRTACCNEGSIRFLYCYRAPASAILGIEDSYVWGVHGVHYAVIYQQDGWLSSGTRLCFFEQQALARH